MTHSSVNLCSFNTLGLVACPSPPFPVFGTKQVLWTYSAAGSPCFPSLGHPQSSHTHTQRRVGRCYHNCESRQIRPKLGALERGAHSQALKPHICTASRGF